MTFRILLRAIRNSKGGGFLPFSIKNEGRRNSPEETHRNPLPAGTDDQHAVGCNHLRRAQLKRNRRV